jgi:peptidyl-prolyl cis-trans isomerase C
MIPRQLYIKGQIGLLLFATLLTACNLPGKPLTPSASHPPAGAATAGGQTPTPATPAGPTASPVEPTATSRALAATVDGQEISQAEYQAELDQYKAAKATDLTPEDRQRALNEMIDQALLAQGAAEQGFQVDEALLQERMKRLSDPLGGPAALDTWVSAHGYDRDSFREALARAVAAAWMRDQIAASLPATADQVHVRQILLYNNATANDVLAQLNAGNDFGNLAVKYDPISRGDLGWFPRGYLMDKKLEEAAFNLQPQAYSEIIQTPAGYHILQLLERDSQRPLTPEARLALQTQAVQNWLQERRSQAKIQILQP